MRVMKFGGTSVGNAERIQNVASIIKDNLGTKPIVIVSAVAGITNSLMELAHQTNSSARTQKFESIRARHEDIVEGLGLDPALLDPVFDELESLCASKKALTKKSQDNFVSFGERLCAPMIAGALEKLGVPSKAFPAWEVGMITDEHFGGAEPLATTQAMLKKEIEAIKVVPVITGYIGKTEKGKITTLGRGGSDYSAALIGAAIKADVIQIWKEVDGIMTTDPRLVPDAKVVPKLAFEEASELAYFGAKVLHPKTILPAMKAGVPVQVLNTFNPKGAGTMIISNFEKRKKASQTIDALAFRKNAQVVTIFSPEFFDGNMLMADIFKLFGTHHVNIDMVAMSVASISLVMNNDEALPKQILEELKKFGDMTVEKEKAIVCAVGGSVNAAGVAGRMFTVLGNDDIAVELINQASGGFSITFIVKNEDAEKALKVLHKEYIK